MPHGMNNICGLEQEEERLSLHAPEAACPGVRCHRQLVWSEWRQTGSEMVRNANGEAIGGVPHNRREPFATWSGPSRGTAIQPPSRIDARVPLNWSSPPAIPTCRTSRLGEAVACTRHAANDGREFETNQICAREVGLQRQKQPRRVNNRAGTSKYKTQQQELCERRKIEAGRGARQLTQFGVPELGLVRLRMGEICIAEHLVSVVVIVHSSKRLATVSKSQKCGHGEAQKLKTASRYAHRSSMRGQHMLATQHEKLQRTRGRQGGKAAGRQREKGPRMKTPGQHCAELLARNFAHQTLHRAQSVTVLAATAHRRTLAVGRAIAGDHTLGLYVVRTYTENPKTPARCCCTQATTTGNHNHRHPKCIARSSASIEVPPSIWKS